MTPFIAPVQLNRIRQELGQLVQVAYFVGDYRVYRAAKERAYEKVIELFDDLSEEQRQLFDGVPDIADQKQLNQFMDALRPLVAPFPQISVEDLRRLYKREKKLPLPDLGGVDFLSLVYLSWRDVSTQSIYLVYPYAGEIVGLKGRYTAGSAKKVMCTFCHTAFTGDHVGLVSIRTRSREYQSVGNYLCLDGQSCNERLTSTVDIDSFFERALTR